MDQRHDTSHQQHPEDHSEDHCAASIAAALRESEERLRLFAEHAPVALAMFDREMRYLAVSRRWVHEYLGDREDVVGQCHYDVFPACPDRWRAAHRRGLAGEIVRVDEDYWTLDSGETIWSQYEVRPWHATDGSIGGIAIFTLDITDRKKREDELRRSREILRRSQEIAKLGSWELDLNTRQMDLSADSNAIIGLGPDQQVTSYESGLALVHPDDRAGVDAEFHQSIEEDRDSFERQFRVLRPGSTEYRYVYTKCDHIRDEQGRIIKAVGIVQDITERTLMEQERQRMQERLQQTQRLQSLGVLAGGIAHDFNNLMMGVLGYAEMLLQQLSEDAPAAASVEAIKSASLQAADLCKQLLAYAGQGKIEEIPFAVNALITQSRDMLKTCLGPNCALHLELAQDEDLPSLLGDPAQIRQIVMNLVINAAEAVGERGGKVIVRTGTKIWGEAPAGQCILEPATAGPYLALEVEDTGCGLAPDTLPNIFEPFFTTKFTGRGLGLSVVTGIIRAHGGGLCVESRPDQGTTFCALFPVKQLGRDGQEQDLPPDSVAQTWCGTGTILLVDDEEVVRGATSQLLRILGFQVVTAIDGEQAVEAFRQQADTIDLVLLDLTMPRMGGEEALDALRRIDPDVKVVVVSGFSESTFSPQFAGKQVVGCLEKPYTLASLREALARVFDQNTTGP